VSNSATVSFSGLDGVLSASNVVVTASGKLNHAGPTTNEASSNRVC
jgi:hypothetical protein